MKHIEMVMGAAVMGAAIKAHLGRAKNRHKSGESGTHNPILYHKLGPTRGNAIKAKCAERMGCTETHVERGFRDAIRACSSSGCLLHGFRPYRANLATKPLKNGQLEVAGGSALALRLIRL